MINSSSSCSKFSGIYNKNKDWTFVSLLTLCKCSLFFVFCFFFPRKNYFQVWFLQSDFCLCQWDTIIPKTQSVAWLAHLNYPSYMHNQRRHKWDFYCLLVMCNVKLLVELFCHYCMLVSASHWIRGSIRWYHI